MVTPASLLNALYFLVNARNVLVNDGSSPIAVSECRDAPGQNQTCAPVPSQLGRETRNATHPGASSNHGGGSPRHIQEDREDSRGQTLYGVPQITNWPGASIDDGVEHLSPGSLVELHGDKSVFAVPAVITGRSKGSSPASAKYDVTPATNMAPSFNVDPEFIHPYRVYDDGTEALCNVGALRGAYMAPCTVEAHFTKTSGFISYHVTYVDASNNELQGYLPFQKVQRKLR